MRSLFAMLSTMLLGSPVLAAESKVAPLIGNAIYDGQPPLRNPIADGMLNVRQVAVLGAGLIAMSASAQTAGPATIRVVGHGTTRTAPDLAMLTFGLRGEGSTQEAAIRALVATRERVEAALSGRGQVTTGRLAVATARDRACNADDDIGERLSTGVCAIRGYVATLRMTAAVMPPTEAGTLLGEVARLGATDPELDRFRLSHPEAAQRGAVADAIRDARVQASAIAAASHVALGRLRRVEDQRAAAPAAQDIVVTAERRASGGPPPISITLTPEPIQTDATLVVEFEVGGPVP